VVRRTTEPENPGSAREPWRHATARIDWLAGPIDELGPFDETAQCWLDKPQPCPPEAGFVRANYKNWIGDRHGSKVGRALDRRGRIDRTYLVVKGTGLMHLRADGATDHDILQRFDKWHGKAARIDLAVDVRHPKITPRAFDELHRENRIVTRLRESWFGGDPQRGETFYLKGRNHQQTFRAYDKSAERKQRGADIAAGVTRLELELRGAWARRAFAKLLKIPHATWEAEFPTTVLGIILSKVRPLQSRRPDHHPNRAPLWQPLVEAVGDLAPVRLPRDEQLTLHIQRLSTRAAGLHNNLSFLGLLYNVLGPAYMADWLKGIPLRDADLDMIREFGPDLGALSKRLLDLHPITDAATSNS